MSELWLKDYYMEPGQSCPYCGEVTCDRHDGTCFEPRDAVRYRLTLEGKKCLATDRSKPTNQAT